MFWKKYEIYEMSMKSSQNQKNDLLAMFSSFYKDVKFFLKFYASSMDIYMIIENWQMLAKQKLKVEKIQELQAWHLQ